MKNRPQVASVVKSQTAQKTCIRLFWRLICQVRKLTPNLRGQACKLNESLHHAFKFTLQIRLRVVCSVGLLMTLGSSPGYPGSLSVDDTVQLSYCNRKLFLHYFITHFKLARNILTLLQSVTDFVNLFSRFCHPSNICTRIHLYVILKLTHYKSLGYF